MDTDSKSQAQTTVRILAIAWTVYGALLDENPATGMVFVVLGLLLLVLSEFALGALDAISASLKDEHRIGWW